MYMQSSDTVPDVTQVFDKGYDKSYHNQEIEQLAGYINQNDKSDLSKLAFNSLMTVIKGFKLSTQDWVNTLIYLRNFIEQTVEVKFKTIAMKTSNLLQKGNFGASYVH